MIWSEQYNQSINKQQQPTQIILKQYNTHALSNKIMHRYIIKKTVKKVIHEKNKK